MPSNYPKPLSLLKPVRGWLKLAGYFALILSLLTIFNLFHPNQVLAAEITSGEDVRIDQPEKNLYTFGQEVKVNTDLQGDAYIAGAKIEINGEVERSLYLAGQKITVDSPRVNQTLHVFGQKVNLSGLVVEDVIVSAEVLTLEDLEVQGDLVVNASTLIINDTVIRGDAKANYRFARGQELKEVTEGMLEESRLNRQPPNVGFYAPIWYLWQLSVLTLFILILSVLHFKKKSKIVQKNIVLGWSIWKDFLLGLGVLVLPFLVMLLSLITLTLAVGVIIPILVYILFFATFAYLPIYSTNLLYNIFKLESLKFRVKFEVLAVFIYILTIVLSLTPVVNLFFGLFIFLLNISAFGYWLRSLWKLV